MTDDLVPLRVLLLTFAGWVNREQQRTIEYLVEENRVLKEQFGGRRLRLTDDQRRRLAAKGKRRGRRLLGRVVTIVAPYKRAMKRERPEPPHPTLRRAPPRSFGWLDARLLHDGWIEEMPAETLALLTLLAIAADEHGASFYGRERMVALLSIERRELDACLRELVELGLLAHRPWSPGHADGVWQLLPLPRRPRRR